MENHGNVTVKTERRSELDEAGSSHSAQSQDSEPMQRMNQRQALLEQQLLQQQQQMAQMLQMMQNTNNGATNASVNADTAYPCPGFGNVAFKRDPEQSFNGSSGSASMNNNSEGTEHLTKEKLWDLYLAGRVSLEGVKDVKPSTKPRRKSAASDSDIEEIGREEVDPAREGFSLNDWDLVYDDGKIAAILCEPCRKSGKEPIPIKGDTLDKLRSFGEQHLVFRHNYPPKGHPSQVGPHPNQCKTCKCFFRAEKLLERHSKTCVVLKKEVKVELTRSKEVEDAGKKRKLSVGSGGGGGGGGENGANKRTNVKKEPVVKTDDAPKKKNTAEKQKPTKKNDVKKGDIKSFFKPADSPPADNDDYADDVPPASRNDDDDEGYDGEEKNHELPLDLITLGDRWHEGDRPEAGFNCPLCKTRPLSRPIFIEDHVAAHHFKQKRYVCTICRKKNEEEEDEKLHVQCAWSHKSTLNEHLQKNHSLQFARQEKLNFKLMEIEPLHPDAVNTMRLFFKLYPKKGEQIKDKYVVKKQINSDNNQKKSKCPECDQKFYTQEERTLIDHIMWRHRDAPRYHCHHCDNDAGFGMVAGFEDHCKREHGCDKNDFVSMLMMKVDKVPEELAKQYYIDDDDYQELHKGREIISDDEEDMPEKKEIIPEMVPDMKIGFRRKEMLFVCRNDDCDWSLSSRELFLVDKINKHTKTHESE